MPTRAAVHKEIGGVQTYPSPIAGRQGGLARADNVVFRRPGVVAKRPGFERHISLTSPASALGEYQQKLVMLDGQTLKCDVDGLGSPVSWSGAFVPPQDSRMRFQEDRKSLYFTELDGIHKQDSLTGVPRRAGAPRAFNVSLVRTGTGNGFMLPDSKVAYRAAWKRKDTNGQVIIGAPGPRETITCPASAQVSVSPLGLTVIVTHTAHGYATGDIIEVSEPSDLAFESGQKTITVTDANTYSYGVSAVPSAAGTIKVAKRFNVTLTTYAPQGVDFTGQSDTYLQVYRSDLSVAATVEPPDRYYLIHEEKASFSSSAVTFTDTKDESLLGEDLYTNDTQETESQANDQPPQASFIAAYRGHMFYFLVRYEHQLEITLQDTTGISTASGSESTITIDSLVYKFSTAIDVATRKFRLYTTADADTPTLAQSIAATMKSFAEVVNRDTSSNLFAYYVSGTNDDPGRVLLRRKTPGGSVFTAQSSVGSKFLPAISTALSSEALEEKAGYVRAKYQEPEATPRFNLRIMGQSTKSILWAVSTESAILVGKEDGVYKITGDTDGGGGFNFTETLLDQTVYTVASRSAVSLDNAVYVATSQGAMRLSDSGSGIISMPILDQLARAATSLSFEQVSHAVAYEENQEWIFFTLPQSRDTQSMCAHVYNYITRAWSRWTVEAQAGIVLRSDRKLYLAHATEPYILRERKTSNQYGDDYVDETIAITVTATGSTTNSSGATVSTVTFSWTGARELEYGWLFFQNIAGASGVDYAEGVIEAVTDLGGTSFRVTLDRLISVNTGASFVSYGIKMDVEWLPEDGGDASTMKHFPEAQIYFASDSLAHHHELGFQADHQSERASLSFWAVTPVPGWGQQTWGTSAWGAEDARRRSTPARSHVPTNHSRGRSLVLSYRNFFAKEDAAIVQKTVVMRPTSHRTQRQP